MFSGVVGQRGKEWQRRGARIRFVEGKVVNSREEGFICHPAFGVLDISQGAIFVSRTGRGVATALALPGTLRMRRQAPALGRSARTPISWGIASRCSELSEVDRSSS